MARNLTSEVARLATLVEAALGPDGHFRRDLQEIKDGMRESSDKLTKHHVRLDRLEQAEKRRNWPIKVGITAWIGMAVAWVWDRLLHRV